MCPVRRRREASCFWDFDPRAQNLEFLNKIDPQYFHHIADLHGEALKGDNRQYSAAALRVAYAQGLETLFALLCATAQAPEFVLGWLLAYKHNELDSIVGKISNHQPILSTSLRRPVTWDVLAEIVFSRMPAGDDERAARVKGDFAKLWRRFASDYLNKNRQSEYNSVKHGLRAKLGGFHFALGVEGAPGVLAPPERMRMLANSEFGSSFFVAERLDLNDGRNFFLRHQSLNWIPESSIAGLRLISTSIANVITFLKAHNGATGDPHYLWHDDESAYGEPWKESAGLTDLAMKSPIQGQGITLLTKEQILSVYGEEGDQGQRTEAADPAPSPTPATS